ncbi:energy transducer TonB [Salinimicrobium sp. CAU 1759]
MKSYLSLSFFLLFSLHIFSQDTIYRLKNGKETQDRTLASQFEVLNKDSDNRDAGYRKVYYTSGQVILEEYFSSFKKKIREGKRKLWRKDGSLWRESDYKKGKLNGYQISYWENGQLLRKDFYKKGKLKEKNVWDIEGNEVEWFPMEQRPLFPGGEKARIKYIKANTKKPEGVPGGKVKVGFVIDVDGTVTEIRIEESTSPGLNLTAFNTVAQMPKWSPGKQDGKPVRVKLTLPLVFRD